MPTKPRWSADSFLFRPLPLRVGRAGRWAVEANTQPTTCGDQDCYHVLLEERTVWMSDLPIEQASHAACLQGARGHVLVGGLGLGLAVHTLAGMPAVERVTVVELEPDVVDLVDDSLPHEHLPIEIIEADLLTWVPESCYDFAFFDIWKTDDAQTQRNIIAPLRRRYGGVSGHVAYWTPLAHMRQAPAALGNAA